MKKILLILLFFTWVINSRAQPPASRYGRIDVEITKQKKPKRIVTKVMIKKDFPGGDSAWIRSLEKQLDGSIPYKNGAKKGKYIVTAQFIIDKEGHIAEVRCINEPVGYGMEEQVLRVLKKSPRWGPGPAEIKPYRKS